MKRKEYVLVSQGIEIFRTLDKEDAEKIMNNENENNNLWKQRHMFDDDYEDVDNEIFMYEEGVIK